MNREKTMEAITIMQAWLAGQVIQGRGTLDGETDWADLDSIGAPLTEERGPPGWNWLTVEYRIKPEPYVFYYVRAADGEFGSYRWRDAKEAEAFIANNPELRWKSVVKFVEVVEGEAKPTYEAGLPPAMAIPRSINPLISRIPRPFVVGDHGKTVGGWEYKVVKVLKSRMEVFHEGKGPRFCYEMVHDLSGSAGPAKPDHQLLAQDNA